MSSLDFASAQKRVAARRQQRSSQTQALTNSSQSSSIANAISALPFPLGAIGHGGLQAWQTIRGREGTRPHFRVGQIDAELLDEELLSLLQSQVGNGLKYFGAHLHTTTGALKSCLLFERFYSSFLYGITSRHTAHHCKPWLILMRGTRRRFQDHLQDCKRACTGYSV